MSVHVDGMLQNVLRRVTLTGVTTPKKRCHREYNKSLPKQKKSKLLENHALIHCINGKIDCMNNRILLRQTLITSGHHVNRHKKTSLRSISDQYSKSQILLTNLIVKINFNPIQ